MLSGRSAGVGAQHQPEVGHDHHGHQDDQRGHGQPYRPLQRRHPGRDHGDERHDDQDGCHQPRGHDHDPEAIRGDSPCPY